MMNYNCQKHFPKKPVIITKKIPCKCQGLCLIKEFCKKNKEKCMTLVPDYTKQRKKEFLTGSFYEGDWTDGGGMHGHGVYTFPNELIHTSSMLPMTEITAATNIPTLEISNSRRVCQVSLKSTDTIDSCRLMQLPLPLAMDYGDDTYRHVGGSSLSSKRLLKFYPKVIGVVYEGEFVDGVMHGKGELRYQTNIGLAIVRGQWIDGVMTERKIFFDDDTLEYDGNNWQYCKMPDRRYSSEYTEGLQPSGISNHTAYQPSKEVPPNCYDTGDGFYDRHRLAIYDHNDLSKIKRGPSTSERKWIKENCRTANQRMHIGPRPDFYEKFVEPTELLEPYVKPAVKYTKKSQKSSIFEDDYDLEDTLSQPSTML